MFRTSTGNTGPTAYVYEAAQIQNCLRELNARAARLAAAMAAELQSTDQITCSIATDDHPDATVTLTTAYDSLGKYIRAHHFASDADHLGRIARALMYDDYVIEGQS